MVGTVTDIIKCQKCQFVNYIIVNFKIERSNRQHVSIYVSQCVLQFWYDFTQRHEKNVVQKLQKSTFLTLSATVINNVINVCIKCWHKVFSHCQIVVKIKTFRSHYIFRHVSNVETWHIIKFQKKSNPTSQNVVQFLKIVSLSPFTYNFGGSFKADNKFFKFGLKKQLEPTTPLKFKIVHKVAQVIDQN